MKKLLIIVGSIFAILVALLVIGLFVLRWAALQEPDFYVKTLEMPPERQEKASEEMLQRAADLRNAADKAGQWEAVFSADQINGWLSVDLVRNHKNAMPASISDPRVSITPNTLRVACRYHGKSMSGVLSLACEVNVVKPNLLAIRIRRVAIGLVPLPMHKVIEAVGRAARENDLILDWHRVEGDPVAMITIVPPKDDDEKRVTLETLQLSDGEVYVAGKTE